MKHALTQKLESPLAHIVGNWKEPQLVALVVARLSDELRGVGDVREERSPRGESRPDAILYCRAGEGEFRFAVQAKRHFWPRDVLQAIGAFSVWRKDLPDHKPIVVADFLPQSSRRILKEQDIAYLDLRGNAWLKFGPVLLDRELPDPRTAGHSEQSSPLSGLTSGRSSRVLRVLLENRDTVWTLPRLAREADVSLGLAWVVARRLSEEGWVEKRRGAVRLTEPGALLDFWASRYDFDRNKSRRFYAPVRSFDDLLERLRTIHKDVSYALTGPAASLLVAPYVRFAVYHLYVVPKFEPTVPERTIVEGIVRESVVNTLDLKPVDTGGANLILLEPYDKGVFYRLQSHRDVPVVCHTQLYLDLVTYPGRGREQADYFREHVLKV